MTEHTRNTATNEMKVKWWELPWLRSFMPLFGFIAIIVVFSILTDGKIIRPRNINLMLSQVYVLMIASMGVFMIMTVGGIDFSQGSILGLSSIIFCWVSQRSIGLGILAAVAAGAAMGSFNGLFHVKFKIASFIVTICTMYLFRGLCKYITTSGPVPASVDVVALNQTWLKVLLTIVVLSIGFFILHFTRVGHDLHAIGAGETAARFSGCRPDLTKFLVFTASGAITGFASFINVIKVGSITGTAGSQLETQILIALVLGGMPISGGAKSRFSNIIIGTLTYSVLEKSLPMIFPVSATQQLVKGIVFLIVVALTIDRKSLRVIK
ncbi:MAG: ABC transporter permease [Sphaerochaeta sp.]|jgi:ribose transport system permease protein|nr:ABC transporter permease [Sphaerochaeta sp.]MCI2076863.1 ABC transporter permease [Sphaerochaeta sp.]MCI2104017.1 ABC transporter permease [Sphaerochaeta sp.]MCI2128742.1 ABC transporter permease [Sphaerochaeta sp.]